MGLPRQQEDLSVEPSVRETLADPLIQTLMRRDGVSEEELLRLILAARARLFPPRDGVVMAFPRREPPAAAAPAAELRPPESRPQESRPRTRWPFCVAQAGAGQSPQKSG